MHSLPRRIEVHATERVPKTEETEKNGETKTFKIVAVNLTQEVGQQRCCKVTDLFDEHYEDLNGEDALISPT
ncbi:hypothetical protein QR680_011775 [Steinernema hermaphroditum]|uniref:Uncharacterized protein n=1 Tax=Steinernema hermaphroditum TaxID=289476 RepID=A0AA39I177_9BILA|nr:hypothetical protein QR680_011775 [Steinernema hermaphroditum]